MLFAEASGDRASFDNLWNWTRDNLQRRDNALFSWRFDPADGNTPVADTNDASDGDILIAWALVRAARRWHEPDYQPGRRSASSRISAAGCWQPAPRRLVLLPGATGSRARTASRS